jgi:bifunctional non-homologous end joining protein LigD
VLCAEQQETASLSYDERRRLLEDLSLPKVAHVPDTYDDGAALFEAVCRRGLEGVVAKRRSERYRPGERSWVKVKNKGYWR